MAKEPRQRREDDRERGRPGGDLGIEPEPREPGKDDVPAADAQEAPEEPGHGPDRCPDTSLGRRTAIAPAGPSL